MWCLFINNMIQDVILGAIYVSMLLEHFILLC